MTKKQKSTNLHNRRIDDKLPELKKCVECKCSSFELINTDIGLLCEECLHNYCEICKKIVPFITVRKDWHSSEKRLQVCSECYMEDCARIIKLDKEYDEKRINK